MKEPRKMTLAGLVARLLWLKAQKKLIDIRREALRTELMGRIAKKGQRLVRGWKIQLRWENDRTVPATVRPGGWRLYAVRRNNRQSL